jgi:hypothetical protein
MRQETVGWGLGMLGAGGVLVGALLPWARLAIFGLEIGLPGVLWLLGAGCIALALIGLGMLARLPWLACACGALCLVLSMQGRAQAPREIVRRKLDIQQQLVPLNDKLARIAVPPLEPFASVGRASDHAGPGAALSLLGSALLTFGGALRAWGRRSGRSSPRFCTRCGTPREIADIYCGGCGASLG